MRSGCKHAGTRHGLGWLDGAGGRYMLRTEIERMGEMQAAIERDRYKSDEIIAEVSGLATCLALAALQSLCVQ